MCYLPAVPHRHFTLSQSTHGCSKSSLLQRLVADNNDPVLLPVLLSGGGTHVAHKAVGDRSQVVCEGDGGAHMQEGHSVCVRPVASVEDRVCVVVLLAAPGGAECVMTAYKLWLNNRARKTCCLTLLSPPRLVLPSPAGFRQRASWAPSSPLRVEGDTWPDQEVDLDVQYLPGGRVDLPLLHRWAPLRQVWHVYPHTS